mgnify:CR=1 FL=1
MSELRPRMFKIHPGQINGIATHLGKQHSCTGISMNVLNFPENIVKHVIDHTQFEGYPFSEQQELVNELERLNGRSPSTFYWHGLSSDGVIQTEQLSSTSIPGPIEKQEYSKFVNEDNRSKVLERIFGRMKNGTGTLLSMLWCGDSPHGHTVVIVKSSTGKPYLIDSQQNLPQQVGVYEEISGGFDHLNNYIRGINDYFYKDCNVTLFGTLETDDVEPIIDLGIPKLDRGQNIDGCRDTSVSRMPTIEEQHIQSQREEGDGSEPFVAQNTNFIHQQQQSVSTPLWPPAPAPAPTATPLQGFPQQSHIFSPPSEQSSYMHLFSPPTPVQGFAQQSHIFSPPSEQSSYMHLFSPPTTEQGFTQQSLGFNPSLEDTRIKELLDPLEFEDSMDVDEEEKRGGRKQINKTKSKTKRKKKSKTKRKRHKKYKSNKKKKHHSKNKKKVTRRKNK